MFEKEQNGTFWIVLIYLLIFILFDSFPIYGIVYLNPERYNDGLRKENNFSFKSMKSINNFPKVMTLPCFSFASRRLTAALMSEDNEFWRLSKPIISERIGLCSASKFCNLSLIFGTENRSWDIKKKKNTYRFIHNHIPVLIINHIITVEISRDLKWNRERWNFNFQFNGVNNPMQYKSWHMKVT